MPIAKTVHKTDWSWGLVSRINESADLLEGLREFLKGLFERYSPTMAGIWLKDEEGWQEADWQGERKPELEGWAKRLLTQLPAADSEERKLVAFPHEAGFLHAFPLHQRRTRALLGACVVLSSNQDLTEQEEMRRWVEHFSWLLALHIEREQERNRYLRQQVALSLILGGSNILNNVANEAQLFTEAGEMAMGILHVDKGMFIVEDALDHDKIWFRGFGRFKDVELSLDRVRIPEQKGPFCDLQGVSLEGECRECPYFNMVCRKAMEDIPENMPEDMLFTQYPLLSNSEAIGELRLLHEKNELAGLDKDTLNTFVLQISVALETLRHRSMLERLATHDPLTGLLNRTGLEERLEAECSRAARAQEQLLFIVLDLDHFKQVNDTFGHPAGDQLLIKIGSALAHNVRVYDLVSRIGGDEFVVVFARWEESQVNYDRVRDWLAEVEAALPNLGIDIGLSAGVARFPENTDFRSLYQKADEALYQAKQQGRHRICGLEVVFT